MPETRARRWVEIASVLLLSLGASAIWAIIQLVDRYTQPVAIADQTATLNPTQSDRPWLDVTYQLVGIAIDLAPVMLVCWLLWRASRPHLGRLGIRFDRLGGDAWRALLLLVVIGVPGIALYLAGRAIGITVNVVPSPIDAHWWTIPTLVLSAFRAGATEEIIVVGYLFERLRGLGWGRWQIIASAALLRGTYHLYQGFGAFIGNIAMGLLFGWLYTRTGRVLPLVIAHLLIDCAVFIGYPWAYQALPALFG